MPEVSFERILLVEDERNLASALELALTRLGVGSVRVVSTLKAARQEILQSPSPELVVLDRMLPDGEGLDLCRELRRRSYGGAILVLTASGGIEQRVEGLDAGADDYLPKPFSWEELGARVRALARRFVHRDAREPWNSDETRLRIQAPSGTWVTLTPLEFRLVMRLMQEPGVIVSRGDLLKEVWGFNWLPKTRTVDHFMGRLRKYFENNPEEPKHFLTVRGAGYRFEP